MTLAISLGNADQIIQVSDRKLTNNGQQVKESHNKTGHAVCDDASFLISYAGLATYLEHNTSIWLLDALYDAAQKSHAYSKITHGLAEEATKYFHSSRTIRSLSSDQKRLTIMLSGYTSHGHIVNSLISNFQDFTSFIDYPKAMKEFTVHNELSIIPAPDNPVLIQVIGQFNAFTNNDEVELRDMLEQRLPAESIGQKAISIIQDISNRPSSNNTVGKKINTARLSFLSPFSPYVGYSSNIVIKYFSRC